jgi:hypothetical protein
MKRTKFAALFAAVTVTAALPTAATAGFVWTETGADGAGDLLPTAQTVYDSAFNTLDEIKGTLTSIVPVGTIPSAPIFQVDLYKIRINDFNNFSAKTVSSQPFVDDTALYLFNDTGFGVYMNDDNAADLLSTLPASDVNSPTSNGIYYLAVALGGFVANDASAMSMFGAGGFADTAAGDPSAGPLAAWTPGFQALSELPFAYDIILTGATNGDLPEPGSLALLMAGGIGAWLARRRPNAAQSPSVAAA